MNGLKSRLFTGGVGLDALSARLSGKRLHSEQYYFRERKTPAFLHAPMV